MGKKKNMPELRFPEFKGEWEWKRLGQLLEFKNGVNANKEQYGKGIKFINVLDILNNEFITYDSIIGSVDVDSDTVNKFPVNYGDILFQRSSETREEVGSASVYLDKEKTATFGGFVIRGRQISEYNPMFFNKLLKTDIARDEITSKSGGSTRYNVGQETLSAVTLPFPTLLEQQKIASFLTSIDTKLQILNKSKYLLERYKKGLMQKIFSQELYFKDDKGKEFPKWQMKKLEDICEVAKSGGTPTSTKKEYYEGDIPFLSISDMTSQGKYLNYTSNHISKLGLENSASWIVPVNSIIYSMYASVGFVAINKIPMATSQAVLNLILKQDFNTDFIYYKLIDFQKHITQFITTGTQGNLNGQTVKGFEISIPCLTEQIKISNFLSSIDVKISFCKSQIEKTEKYRKGLLQKMFC